MKCLALLPQWGDRIKVVSGCAGHSFAADYTMIRRLRNLGYGEPVQLSKQATAALASLASAAVNTPVILVEFRAVYSGITVRCRQPARSQTLPAPTHPLAEYRSWGTGKPPLRSDPPPA